MTEQLTNNFLVTLSHMWEFSYPTREGTQGPYTRIVES